MNSTLFELNKEIENIIDKYLDNFDCLKIAIDGHVTKIAIMKDDNIYLYLYLLLLVNSKYSL